MKIAIATFNCHENYALGVAAHNLSHGFDELGIKNDLILLRKNGKSTLNWGEDYNLVLFRNAPRVLSKYDATIMTLPCPHNSKAGKQEKGWERVYEADTKFFPRIRDARWDSEESYGYPHFTNVADKVECNVAVSKPAFESVKNYPSPCVCIPVAMETPNRIPPQTKRKRQICSFNAFTATSNNQIAIRSVPDLDCQLVITGKGIEWHYMQGEKRKNKYKENGEWIWERAMESGNLTCLGYEYTDASEDGVLEKHWVPEEKKIQTYLDSRMSFVLEEKNAGLLYVSLIEGLMYGAVPVVLPRTIKNTPITEDMVVVANRNSFAKKVNDHIDDTETLQQKTIRGHEFARKNFGAKNVAQEWLKLIDGETDVGFGWHHEGGKPITQQTLGAWS